MKKYITTSISLFLLLMLLSVVTPTFAASPPPPPPPGHGTSGNVPGGGAPVGEGLAFLIALGAAYGYKKWKGTKEA
jgi:hypothetical protein